MQEIIGCFNYGVVTLVAVRRQWLWVMTKLILVLEDILLPEPKSYLTIDNPQNICEGVTTTTLEFKKMMFLTKAGHYISARLWLLLHTSRCNRLAQMCSGYYNCKMLVR